MDFLAGFALGSLAGAASTLLLLLMLSLWHDEEVE